MDLASNEVQMAAKISLLCLMEMTFKRPATDRRLTFDDISTEAKVSTTIYLRYIILLNFWLIFCFLWTITICLM